MQARNVSSMRLQIMTGAAMLALSAATSALAQGAANPGAAPAPELRAPQAATPSAGSLGTAGDVGTDAANVAASKSDWPCVQAKIDKIDSAAVWDGPAVEGLKGDTDDAMDEVIKAALSRRNAMPDVEKAIATYAKSIAEGERDAKLTLMFANILQSANTQRTGIVNGIERYQKRQRINAKEIESQGAAISDLEAKAPSDLTQATPELDAAREKYDWFARVFQERQGNIPIACEIPTLIEQRVFAVARAIRGQMKS